MIRIKRRVEAEDLIIKRKVFLEVRGMPCVASSEEFLFKVPSRSKYTKSSVQPEEISVNSIMGEGSQNSKGTSKRFNLC